MNKKNLFIIVSMLVVLGLFVAGFLYLNKKSSFEKCGDLLSDFEGNRYETVEIAGKCWMRENIRTQKDVLGRKVKRTCYEGKDENCQARGGLYTYRDIFNGDKNPEKTQGICPDGWHIPNADEYGKMLSEFGQQACSVSELDKNNACKGLDKILENPEKNNFALQKGGSCDLVCNYQDCKYVCNGADCKDTLAYTLNAKEGNSSLPGRIVINSCDPVKGQVDTMMGGLDSGISLRCIMD